MNEQINRLKQQLQSVQQEMDALVAAADAREEGGLMTAEESARFDQLQAQFNTLDADIRRREALASNRTYLATSGGRRTEPEQLSPANPSPAGGGRPGPRPDGGASLSPAEPHDRRCGFGTFGQYLRAVMAACADGGTVDPRLRGLAPTAYGNEQNGPDGGYAVPPDFRTEIVARMYADESLLSRTDQLVTSTNSLTIPMDEQNPWDSGGIRAYWREEAAQITQSKPVLRDRTIKMGSLSCLVPVTDELMQDAPAMEAYIRRKAPDAMTYKVNEALLFGTGVGQPTGACVSPSVVTVSKESGQSADTIVYANMKKMYSRMYGPCRKTAVWLYNQDCETQLFDLFMPGGGGTGTPVFLPAGGISGQPYATLYGRPMIPLENCAALGDLGDIIFWDPKKYATLTRQGQQVRQDVSMHLLFDYAMQAFRFLMRLGGEPWWTRAFTRAKGANTLGATVVLEERS